MNDVLEMPALATKLVFKKQPGIEIQILLVGNDGATRSTLTNLLHEEHCLALTADSGAEGIELIEALKIDLVVLDMALPYDDGAEMLDWLMANHPLLPVILIAAHPNQFLPASALRVGALLERPLDCAQFCLVIRQLLQEPETVRLARINLHPGMFHYVPSKGDIGAPQTRFER
ncbi:MAG TPA: response regulator [Candidatus Sulfotelmatobacter sp.]|jgi:DNA-binding NtrC family response regulator|nr:response regulator [Candidatus Sulfotelmatobacter sp.]